MVFSKYFCVELSMSMCSTEVKEQEIKVNLNLYQIHPEVL